jgi:predicted DNA-binding protein (MmcQ/YjbR family)
MDLELFRDYCLTKPGVTEEFPFDEHTLVYKVMGKMFAATDISDFESINLKCLPENAEELRAQYESVQPGYHMNKKHWNTIQMDHSIPDKTILEWIDDSYRLVVAKLPKPARQELGYADLKKD